MIFIKSLYPPVYLYFFLIPQHVNLQVILKTYQVLPSNKENTEEEQKASKGKHIKWAAIVIVVLIIFMIVGLDQCYRAGDI